jgi:SRSO17 transposase
MVGPGENWPMAYEMDAGGEQRLERYLDQIGGLLGDSHRRASFAAYAMGLLSESERKSIEPLAARASATPAHASAAHQKLHHFIANTTWSDHDVRLAVLMASRICRFLPLSS